jgi:hypothetical protein
MTTFNFGVIEDAVARVCADAIDGHIYAAGIDATVTSAKPLVVPLDRNFIEADLPAVTCVIGDGDVVTQPGVLRPHIIVLGVVWREGTDLGQAKNLLLEDLAKLIDAFAAHTKAYLVEASVQSALFARWTRPMPRSFGDQVNPGTYLTLPFEIDVVAMRAVTLQPA